MGWPLGFGGVATRTKLPPDITNLNVISRGAIVITIMPAKPGIIKLLHNYDEIHKNILFFAYLLCRENCQAVTKLDFQKSRLFQWAPTAPVATPNVKAFL